MPHPDLYLSALRQIILELRHLLPRNMIQYIYVILIETRQLLDDVEASDVELPSECKTRLETQVDPSLCLLGCSQLRVRFQSLT